ncbi:MAG: hypothetical protein JSV03_00730 [Planctomycetota bacterium]|nr:MAG: hypothetical protein JSV03_00730 [Planctomycetota bacterium]
MDTVIEARPLGFFGKLRVFAACAIAVLLMRTVGWHVVQPIDPDLAVTMSAGERSVISVWIIVFVLTSVAAVIGTVIIGRRLPEGGIFAAAVGLSALGLQGGSMQMVLAYECGIESASRRALMMKMGGDCILWASILVISWVVVVVVKHWLWPIDRNENVNDQLKAAEISTKPNESVTSQNGWPALIVTTLVAIFVIWITIARTPVAQIARGQIIASVFGGLFLGAMAARYFTTVSDSRWYALAAPAVGLIAYLVGFLSADMGWAQGGRFQFYALLNTTPPHALARALPIEYVAVGVSGVLMGYWCGQKMEHVAEQESV